MCLLLLALNAVPGRPWLLLGNRDEFMARATAAASAWADAPAIAGGRDLVAGGSWLALHRDGRFAAVTNVRGMALPLAARSRGGLVADFLAGAAPAADYVAGVAGRSTRYGPFNLVVGDAHSAWFVSSIDAAPQRLADGVHVFSNGAKGDEWPKQRALREGFGALLRSGKMENAAWLDLLLDTTRPDDALLPDTGVGLDWERRLAPIRIVGADYGTRASTLAYARAEGGLVLHERRFGPNGASLGETVLTAGAAGWSS